MARRSPRRSTLRLRSPGALLAESLEVTGRTGRAGIVIPLLVAGGLWSLRHWGPALVPDWGRWHEALATVPLALMLVPLTGLALRRLGDAGLRGWWALLLLVPWARWGLGLVLLLAPSSQRRRRGDGAGRLAALGVAGVAGLVLLLSLLWTVAPVVAGGMKPALLPGDLALLRRSPLAVGRGDVIAFRLPGEAWPQVGRVVALPGETVAVEGGLPVIDGVAATATADGWWTETFGRQGPLGVMPICGNGTVGLGAACSTKALVETLPGGRTHAILDAGPRPLDRVAAVTVPEGRLYVLGDHRDEGHDSRRAAGAEGAGMVPVDRVLGRVDRVLASSGARRPWDPRGWRWGRVLEDVE